MKTFYIYWQDGNKTKVEGNNIGEACDRAGIGAGAIRAMDFYSGTDDSIWDGKQWVKTVPTVAIETKVTDRHGGKGVVCEIADEEIMPVDNKGNRAHILGGRKEFTARAVITRELRSAKVALPDICGTESSYSEIKSLLTEEYATISSGQHVLSVDIYDSISTILVDAIGLIGLQKFKEGVETRNPKKNGTLYYFVEKGIISSFVGQQTHYHCV